MTGLRIDAGPVTLRRWRESDIDALVAEADNRAVWRNMLDVFPHPYTRSDGELWIGRCMRQEPPADLVLALEDQLIGACGANRRSGVSRYTANVGYWLGENHWGRGIMTEAFGRFLEYVWETFDVERLEAEVFAWNQASVRVLEKNGFIREGTRRRAIYKDDEFVDEHFYSLLRSEAS